MTIGARSSLTQMGLGLMGLGLVGLALVPGAAEAQVAISAGVTEIYDDNIYLEDDKGVPPPFVVDDDLGDPSVIINPPEQADGDPNDDLITNVYIGASGVIPLTPALKTSAEGKVGGLIFSDASDESRLTLDSLVKMATEKSFLPDPFGVELSSRVESRSNDVTTADGTATRQSQVHTGALDIGARGIELRPKLKFGTNYIFSYVNYLGDFTLNNKDTEQLGPFEDRYDDRGSDYFSNYLGTNLDYDFSDKLSSGLYANVVDMEFTNVETNDLDQKTEDDLNRLDGATGVSTKYQITKDFQVDGRAGVSLSHLKKQPEDIFFNVIDADGNVTQVQREGDRDTTSLEFAGALNYAPNPAQSAQLRVDQSQSTDVDGDRIISRSVSLNGLQGFGDRFKVVGSGRFLQYNIGDSISQPTERYDVSASVQYSLTQSISLTAGWNYTKQETDPDNLEQTLLFNSEDYEGNRFFVGIEAGLVGTRS